MRGNTMGSRRGRAMLRRTLLAAAVGATFGAAIPAQAFEIPFDNPDIVMRWDNTVRYNIGMRTQGQDQNILKNPNYDDGDRNFSNGSIVTNRFDVLSEFDVVWNRQFGARVSAAGWYDFAYGSLDNTNTATANTLINGLPVAGQLQKPNSKRYTQGPSAEWLDAFVFANVDIAGMPFNAKVGQHTVYWGDSLLFGGAIHGVSYGQNALDIQKAFATPGAEAKELFRPRGGITLQLQPHPDLSVAGQWFYNWQPARVAESGSYLSIGDPLLFGGDSFITGLNPLAAAVPGSPSYWRAWHGPDLRPKANSGSLGDWGISGRWSPHWLDGTVGAYYRVTTDIMPQLMLTQGVAALPVATCTAIGGAVVVPGVCIINKNATNATDLTQKGKMGEYNAVYGNDIKIMGLTLSKNIEGVSVGAELSYRQNMPLISEAVVVLPAPLVPSVKGSIATTAVPTEGTPGALGDTMHGILNAVYILPRTPLFDTATISGELTWMQWLKVTQNEAVFKGRDGYNQIDRVSKNYWGLAVNFTPSWLQVLPGVDLFMPISWSQGMNGNAAVTVGGNEGGGSWSAGLSADIYQKYRVDLKYTGSFGDYATDPTPSTPAALGNAMGVNNGVNSVLSDRGYVSLTFKTTF
jgi:hypothetical protein